MTRLIFAAALLLGLHACSSEPAGAPDVAAGATNESGTSPAPAARSPAPVTPAAATPSANMLTLAGLGALKIGAAVPAGSGWAERGAQIPGGCTTVSSPNFLGAHAIVEGGKVRRITVGERSDVKLVEGIGTGATEAAVRAAFPGFREERHEDVAAPAKYLTAPGATGDNPALRFEIDANRKVSLIHVGTMPTLAYVEGCA